MIPILRKYDVLILDHLARYRVEDRDYVPFGICRLGITRALAHPYHSNVCRAMDALRDARLVDEFRATVKKYPDDISFIKRSAMKVKCYQLTDAGRAIIKGYREAYPGELGARA